MMNDSYDEKLLLFKNANTKSDNSPSPRIKRVQSNIYCTICGRSGHYGSSCAASIQIFEWPYPTEGEVFIVGDFSRWQTKQLMHPPDRDHHYHWLQLSLAPSKYQYKYVVNGEWKINPKSPTIIDNQGQCNNLIEIQPARFEESDEDDDENPNEYVVTIEKKAGASSANRYVKISYPFEASWVTLKGSWDDWSREIPLKKIKNNITGHYEFYVKLRIPKGIYEYKYLVDGQWVLDQTKKTIRRDNIENNILDVKNKSGNKSKTTFLEKDKLLKWDRYDIGDELPVDFKHMFQGHSMSVVGEEVYIFGGMHNRVFGNTMYKLDISTNSISIVDQLGPIPGRRAHHIAIVFYNKIIIFGGFNEKHVFDDYHVFNTANKTWTDSPVLGGDIPPLRERCTLVSYHEQNLILFGGYYCSPDLEYEEHYNDVHALNLSSLEWHKIECSGDIPAGRFGHTACMIGSDMYCFGGVARIKSVTKNYNDLYSLKINKNESTMKWTLIEAKGTPPEPRHGHSAILVATTTMIIYGGRGNLNKIMGDVVIFDSVNEAWVHPEVVGISPKSRYYHACSMLSNQSELLIFGGFKKEFNVSKFFKLSSIDKDEDRDDDEDYDKVEPLQKSLTKSRFANY